MSRIPRPTRGSVAEPFPDFLTFRERFWKRDNFHWQADAYKRVQETNRLIMLIPPGHTKTMTWAIEYSAYKLITTPNFRILDFQKSADEAKKVVGAVQERLTSEELYHDMLGLPDGQCPICLWGPFRPAKRYRESATWGADHFRMAGFASGEKDYSMEAKGIGSAKLSTRPDLIIVDDPQEPGEDTPSNSLDLLRIIQQALLTRGYGRQQYLFLGSRLGPTDIWSHMLENEAFSTWPVVKYPAIMNRCLVHRGKRSNGAHHCRCSEAKRMLVPELRGTDGEVDWDYNTLKLKRKEVGSSVWWTSYMMEEGDFSVAVFKKDAIEACYDSDYSLGDVPNWVTDIFIGVDPAISGFCAMTIWGLNRKTGQRCLIDYLNKEGMRTFGNVQKQIAEFVAKYGIKVAAVELANVQGSISNDEAFVRQLKGLGCRVVNYATRTAMGARAELDDFDISSIGALFDEGLVTIPYMDTQTRKRIKPFVDQFLDWRPKPKGAKSWHLTRDMVMATLFAESVARETYLNAQKETTSKRTNRAPKWAKDRMAAWRKTA